MFDPVTEQARKIHIKKREDENDREEQTKRENDERKAQQKREEEEATALELEKEIDGARMSSTLLARKCSVCGRKVKELDENKMCMSCRRQRLIKIYKSRSSPYHR